MDSNDLEKERGITILAKATSVVWKDTRINIVDTPGHADFGGEVERILSMVDGVIVLVDAAEGPMPQTKFVVSKALKIGLQPDRRHQQGRPAGRARRSEVINEVFDLFAALDATDEQLDFPILYGSGRNGWMAASPEGPKDQGLAPLFDLVLSHVPPAQTEDGPVPHARHAPRGQPLPRPHHHRPHRLRHGQARTRPSRCIDRDGRLVENGRVSKILAFRGLERQPIELGEAGDIVAIAGLDEGHRRRHLLRPRGRRRRSRRSRSTRRPSPCRSSSTIAARRHRGRQGHEPRDPRPPAPRGRGQRRAEDRGIGRQGFLLRLRAAASCSSRS